MTLALLLTGTTECDSLIERYVVADLTGLTDDNSGSVIDEKSLSDRRSRVNLYACLSGGSLRNQTCLEILSFVPKLMGFPMRPHHVITGVQKHIPVRTDGRIAFFINFIGLFEIFKPCHFKSPLFL